MQLPLFELACDWKLPVMADLPNWQGAKRIAIDVETKDLLLTKLGIGVRRGGHIVGISFAIEDAGSYYLPVRHEGGDNLPVRQVFGYLKEQAAAYRGDLVGANLGYDLDYLAEEGVVFPNVGWYRDVQVAEPLLDENQYSFSLDNIAKRHGFAGKDEAMLRAAISNYGLKKPKAELYKLPGRYVGAYAEGDVTLPLKLIRKQERMIDEQDLWGIYNLESKVLPVLLKMRRRGVRVDVPALNRIGDWSVVQENAALKVVKDLTGVEIHTENVNKKGHLARALHRIDVKLKKTADGQWEITKEVLEAVDHPVAAALLRAKKMNRLRNTFVTSVNNHMVNGRIHCTFNQMRHEKEGGEDGGARYGRMSCSDPNMQQQYARDPEIAPIWRAIYIPDHEEQEWVCADYSQQEPRWLTHFAELCKLPEAAVAAQRYRDDPSMDNHNMMTNLVYPEAIIDGDGWKHLRDECKQIYLGLCYAMGGAKLARKISLPTKFKPGRDGKIYEVAGDEAQKILDLFDSRAPFVKKLRYRCERRAKQLGYITTVGGRRCHFPKKKDGTRDWAHKALNRLIQGSSGDQMKQAMVNVDDAGLPMQLQVHDELDASIDNREQAFAIGDVMRESIPANVPFRVDIEVGPNWGAIKSISK